jgi:predicted sulfurtransferase
MTHFPVRRWPALLAALALITLVPSTAGPALAADAADNAPRITAEEVKRLAEKGEVVLIDTRGKDAYDAEHAQGALSVPLTELESRLADLPKDKLIAAYCT